MEASQTPQDDGREQAAPAQQEAQQDSELQTQQPDQPVPSTDSDQAQDSPPIPASDPNPAADAEPVPADGPSDDDRVAEEVRRQNDLREQNDEHNERTGGESSEQSAQESNEG